MSREGKLKKIVYLLAVYRWFQTCQVEDGFLHGLMCILVNSLLSHSKWDFLVANYSKAISQIENSDLG